MKSKTKAQIRMTETIAIMFIFFIIIIFGIIFYSKYQSIAFKEKQKEILQDNAEDITLKTLNLPEITCTKSEYEAEDNCFDILKLNHAQSIIEQNFIEYYSDLFPFAKITVEQIYPLIEENTPIIWTIYQKEKEDFTFKEPRRFIVMLKDDTTNHFNFGVLTVEVYS